MNDLSAATAAEDRRWRFLGPVPTAVPCVLVPLLLAALGFGILILVVVHNAVFLGLLLLLSALVAVFLFWNSAAHQRNSALLSFLDRFPCSDLRTAKDGQLVKVTGFTSCGDISLESSYEKVGRCIYTSTLLYEYSGFRPRGANAKNRYFHWNVAHLERFIADFYITDEKSGIRVSVKSGQKSKVVALITESILINTRSVNRELSPTLKKWLQERNLSSEPRLLRLEEGYVKEGTVLIVMGMLSKKNGELMIVPLPETISTGCLFGKLLLPIDVEGIVLKASGISTSRTDLAIS